MRPCRYLRSAPPLVQYIPQWNMLTQRVCLMRLYGLAKLTVAAARHALVKAHLTHAAHATRAAHSARAAHSVRTVHTATGFRITRGMQYGRGGTCITCGTLGTCGALGTCGTLGTCSIFLYTHKKKRGAILLAPLKDFTYDILKCSSLS